MRYSGIFTSLPWTFQLHELQKIHSFQVIVKYLMVSETQDFSWKVWEILFCFCFSTSLEDRCIDFRKGEGKERKREKHPLVASGKYPSLDKTLKPCLCPAQNGAWDPLVYRTMLQPTESHWTGCDSNKF